MSKIFGFLALDFVGNLDFDIGIYKNEIK